MSELLINLSTGCDVRINLSTFLLHLSPIQHVYMNISRKVLTLDEYTIQQVRQIPNATGELSALLRDIISCQE